MNRIFHARTAWYHYFLLIVLGVNVVAALWSKQGVLSIIFMLLLVVIIEQIIHTAYTVTADDMLIISNGRFLKKQTIPIRDITAVRKHHSMKFGRFSITNYVLIDYGAGKQASAIPVKEQEFMELLEKRRKEL